MCDVTLPRGWSDLKKAARRRHCAQLPLSYSDIKYHPLNEIQYLFFLRFNFPMTLSVLPAGDEKFFSTLLHSFFFPFFVIPFLLNYNISLAVTKGNSNPPCKNCWHLFEVYRMIQQTDISSKSFRC